MNFDYWNTLFKEQSLPRVIVDMDAVDRNIAYFLGQITDQSNSRTIRVATKSFRSPDLIRHILNSSRRFQGLLCYSALEIEALASQGFDDFLLAYPECNPDRLRRLHTIHSRGKKVVLSIDSHEGFDRVAKVFAQDSQQTTGNHSQKIPVVVDLSAALRLSFLSKPLLHLGVQRSPTHSVDQALSLAKKIATAPWAEFHGYIQYEAQVAGLPDRSPNRRWMNPIKQWVREKSNGWLLDFRRDLIQATRSAGLPLNLFNIGGSGSFSMNQSAPTECELTLGSGILAPHLFDQFSNLNLSPALFLALQVTRIPAPGYVTCASGGFIASGPPSWDRLPLPVDPPGLAYIADEGAGEVQTPFRVTSSPGSPRQLSLGDCVFLRPAKAGDLAERFSEYLLVRGTQSVGTAKTYRGLFPCLE